MKRTLTSPARESWVLRETPPIYHATAPPPKTRVAVFGSFMGGYHVPCRNCSPARWPSG